MQPTLKHQRRFDIRTFCRVSLSQEAVTTVRAQAEGAPPEYLQASTHCGIEELAFQTCPVQKIYRIVSPLSVGGKIKRRKNEPISKMSMYVGRIAANLVQAFRFREMD